MKIHQALALGAFVLVTGSAFADSGPVSASQVRQDILDARAAGQLRPAGAAGDNMFAASARDGAVMTRGDIERQTAAARASGELAPAGEAGDQLVYTSMKPSGPGLTRGQVHAETQRARATGMLVPAGQQDLAQYDEQVSEHAGYNTASRSTAGTVAAAPGNSAVNP